MAENNHAKELHLDFFFIPACQKPTLFFSDGEMSNAKKGQRTARERKIQCGSLVSDTVMMMADKASVSQHGTGHCLHTATAAWRAGLGSSAAKGGGNLEQSV